MIVIPQSNKGEMVLTSFELQTLLSSALVSDPYFQNYENIESLIVYLKSSPGNQTAQIRYSIPENYNGTGSVSAYFGVSEKARDSFSLLNITLVDYQGGTYTITRAEYGLVFNLNEFDVSFGV